MPKNRLRLDFSLQTTEERLNFLESYLPTLTFTPDEHETETLSDYVLWGKNQNGLNAQQEGSIILKEWASSKVESIEGLLENPCFQESKFQSLDQTHYRTRRTIFNREETLQKAPPHLQSIFNELFAQIDYIELVINYYDILHDKRKTPPRASLLSKFTEEKRQKIEEKAAQLNQRQYLKMRHHLVELRTEQYTYSDSISNAIIPHSDEKPAEEFNCRFGEDIEVRPMGLWDDTSLSQKIFAFPPAPSAFSESDLQKVSDWLWKPKNNNIYYLDFENTEHILALLKSHEILEYEAERDPNQFQSSAASILKTLQFYIDRANLNELQREILDMKILQQSNTEITKYINGKYGTTYNDNYISTIYRKKILSSIAQAASYHRLIMENIFYPENFKVCKDCGRLYLRSPEFYVRQHKAPDGFAPRCKSCSKKKREEDKAKYEIKYVVNGLDN